MSTVSEIWVRINADVGGLQRGLTKSSAEMRAFGTATSKTATTAQASASKLSQSFAGVGATFKALAPAFAIAGAVAIGVIIKAADATVQWARSVRTLQRVTGQSAESSSALLAVMEEFGLEATQATVGLGIFDKNIITNSKNLAGYGLEVRDAAGELLPFDTILGNAADKFVSLGNAQKQTAFAMIAFGRSGKSLIPILRQGSAGLEALKEDAKSLGLVIGEDTVDSAIALGRAERELGSAVKGAAVSIGTSFLPVLTTMVNGLKAAVEVFTHIPAPIKTATLSFFVLTGALAALQLVAGFFVKTWTKLMGQVGLTGAAVAAADTAIAGTGLAAAVAMPEIVALTASIDALNIAMGGTVPAAAAASAAVLTEAEIAVLAAGTTGAAAGGLGAAIASAATALLPFIAIAAAVAAAAFLIYKNWATLKKIFAPVVSELKGAFEQIKTSLSGVGAAFADLGRAFAPLLTTLQPLLEIFGRIIGAIAGLVILGPIILALKLLTAQLKLLAWAVDWVTKGVEAFTHWIGPVLIDAANLAIQGVNLIIAGYNHLVELSNKFLGTNFETVDAIATVGSTAVDASAGVDVLAESTGGLREVFMSAAEGIDSTTAPLLEAAGAVAILSGEVDSLVPSLDALSKTSAQDFAAIGQTVADALASPTTKIADLPGIVQTALESTHDAMKAWHDSIVETFGGASAALSQFLGQAAGQGTDKVSFANMTKALKDQRAELKRWQTDFTTILGAGGKAAKTFLEDMSANGLDSIGMMDQLAQQPKKVRDEFLKNYAEVNSTTDSLATTIQNAFGKMADHVILALKRILNQVLILNNLPPIPINVDNKQALAALEAVRQKALDIHAALIAALPPGGNPRVNTGALGGVVTYSGIQRFAMGGSARDTIPAMLAPGEFVVRSESVNRVGLGFMRRLNEGGTVTPPASAKMAESGGPSANDLEQAFRRALRAEREKLYLDRRRFSRDLDYAVIQDGQW